MSELSFEDAIALTQSYLEQIEAGKFTEEQTQQAIADLVKSENGARGFFVTYLTDSRTIADNPSAAIIAALQSSPEIVSELLAKNIAMSAAMAVTHRRNQNEPLAISSDSVQRRTANIIKQMHSDILTEKLKQLKESAMTSQGKYQDFLKRWGYDSEQLKVIEEAISEVI